MAEFNQHYREIDKKENELADTRKRLQSETADQLMQVYSAATQLFAGDFTVVTTAIMGQFKDKLIDALSRSPEITSALGDLSAALTGPLGIAVMFGSLLVGSVMRAADEARKIAKEVSDNAVAVDRLINPEKYKNENPRFRQLETALTQAQEIAQKAEDAVMDFTKSPAGLVTALTGGAIGGDTFKTLRDAAAQARGNVTTLTEALRNTPRTIEPGAPAGAVVPMDNTGVEQTIGGTTYVGVGGGRWMPKSLTDKPEGKPAAMPGETPDRPIYTQVVNVRDFREAFPDSAYFRAPSVDTTRSLNANAVAYR